MYKRQVQEEGGKADKINLAPYRQLVSNFRDNPGFLRPNTCLLYTSDAADERSSVDLGGRRIIKKKSNTISTPYHFYTSNKLQPNSQ